MTLIDLKLDRYAGLTPEAIEAAAGQRCYFYHVEKEGKPIATVELLRYGTKPTVGHARGPCNAIVDKKITQILRKWVRQIKEVPAVQAPGLPAVGDPRLAQLDDEIPF